MQMSSPVKACVLGVGLAGLTFHVPFVLALPQHFILHAVLERNPTTPGGKIQARFGPEAAQGVKIYNTLDQVLSDPEIELVIVGTPNETHYEFSKRALEAGKHVLVDKPITATYAQAIELGELAKSKKLVLYPYQNRRWDSDFLALRELLSLAPSDPKSLGVLYELESRFDRYRPTTKGTWKDLPLPASGLTYDLGAHLIDQCVVLFGRPSRVTGLIGNLRGIGSKEVDDNFTILLHYPALPVESAPFSSSAPAQIRPTSFTAILRSTTLSVHSPPLRYIARGTLGTYTKSGVDLQEEQLKVIRSPREIETDENYGVEPEESWGVLEVLERKGAEVSTDITRTTWPSTARGQYQSLFIDLAHAIRLGTPQTVKWEESAAVIQIIELAHQSAKEGRTLDVPAQ